MSFTRQITKDGVLIIHPTGVRQTLRVADIDAEMTRLDEQIAEMQSQKQSYQTSKDNIEVKVQQQISELT